MIWRRTMLLALLTITGLAIETSLLGGLTLLGTKPALLLLITIAMALEDGPALGAVTGFVTGLMTDAVLQLPQGVSALTFMLTGYAVGSVRAQFQPPSAWMPMAIALVTTFVALLFYGGFSVLLGQASLPGLRIVRHAGLAAAYNALLTPFVFPFVRVLARTLRPRASEVMR